MTGFGRPGSTVEAVSPDAHKAPSEPDSGNQSRFAAINLNREERETTMRFTKKIGAVMVAGLVPLALALAQTPANSGSSQRGTYGSMGMAGGRMMGNHMMTFNNQVLDLLTQLKDNLTGLEGQNDVGTIHKQITQDQKLIDQLEGTLNGHCGMSMGPMGSHMYNGQMMGYGNMMGGGMMMGNHTMMGGSNMPASPNSGATNQKPDRN